MTRPYSISRRGFLAGAALAPFIPAALVRAQSGAFPKRLVLFYTPDGCSSAEAWAPAGTADDLRFGPIHQPLDRHRHKCVLIRNMRINAGGAGEGHAYGMGGLWTASRVNRDDLFDGGNGNRTGWGSGTSVDQTVANALGNDPRFRSLELGVQTGGAHIFTRMVYAGNNAPVAPEDNPTAAFDRIFGAAVGEAAAVERARAGRQSVLDVVKGQLDDVKGRYGGNERQKLESHLDSVRSMERQLTVTAPTCAAPTRNGTINHSAPGNFPLVGELQTQLLVRALACDLTRVASLQWSRGISGVVHTWNGLSEQHHHYSHNGGRNQLDIIDRWYAEQFASLLDQLDAVPEGNGTLLDNTIVVWGKEMGIASRHGAIPTPFVVAGGGSTFRLGRVVDADGAGHARLLVSLAQAMGLNNINTYGNLDTGSGPLAGLA